MHTIKHLRNKKNISQTDLAKVIDVSLRTIQLYERKNANIPIKNLTKIADYFELTIAELYLHEVNEERSSYGKTPFTHFGTVCYPLDYGKFLIKAPLLLAEAQAEYLNQFRSKKSTVIKPSADFVVDFLIDGRYKAFEITGESMNDGSIDSVPNKSVVLCVEIPNNELAEAASKTMVLVCADRVICKRVTGLNRERGIVSCENLNKSPEYSNFDLPIDNILEAYQVVKRQF